MLDEHTLTAPNQGIWLSARNGVRVGLTFWLFTGLSIVLITGLLSRLVYGPIFGLTQGLMLGLVARILCGLIAGLANSGLAGIQHLALRVFLRHLKCAPRNYPRFLDYTAKRILLRKVGGGYIFVHRLLLEYFTSLNTMSSPHQIVEPVQASRTQPVNVEIKMIVLA